MGLLYNRYEANPTTNIKVNAVSGTLIKTFRKSFFERFHMNSQMANQVFNKGKPYLGNSYNEIVVLQVMLCGDKEFLAELIYKKDYDEIFKEMEQGKDENNK